MNKIDISYHEIGDVFDYDGTKLKVVSAPIHLGSFASCTGCNFEGVLRRCDKKNCHSGERADGRCVIYCEIKKNTDMENTKAEMKYLIAEKLNNLKDELFQIVENIEPIIVVILITAICFVLL